MDKLRDRVSGFLRHRGIKLNTDLGQHFLVDEDVLETIVDAAGITERDHVVEIGPGIGILTEQLLERASHVTAIELDDRLIPLMKSFLKQSTIQPFDHLIIVSGNALKVPFPEAPYKVVANIPYHITSPLLRHAYLESELAPTTMTLLIQREVAEKICDEEHAGILTIMVKLFGAPKLIHRVPSDAFLPPPKVDSAVLHITSHEKPPADRPTIDKILRLLKTAFAGKRKMLRNTIGKLENGAELLKGTGIDPMRRPETVKVEEWMSLARAAG